MSTPAPSHRHLPPAVPPPRSLLGLPPLQGALRASRLHISFYPLHAAVMNEDVGQVTELLAQGQDPNQTDFFSVSDD